MRHLRKMRFTIVGRRYNMLKAARILRLELFREVLYLVGYGLRLFLNFHFHLYDQYFQFPKTTGLFVLYLSGVVYRFAVFDKLSSVSILWKAIDGIQKQFELFLNCEHHY